LAALLDVSISLVGFLTLFNSSSPRSSCDGRCARKPTRAKKEGRLSCDEDSNIFKKKKTDMSPQFNRYPQPPSVEATIASPLGCHYYLPVGSNEQAHLSSNESRFHHLFQGEHPQFANYLARQYPNVMSYFQAVMPGFGSCAPGMDLQQVHEHGTPLNQDVSQTPHKPPIQRKRLAATAAHPVASGLSKAHKEGASANTCFPQSQCSMQAPHGLTHPQMSLHTTAAGVQVGNETATPSATSFRLRPEAPEFIPGRKFEPVHVRGGLKQEQEAKA
jgi:hypothetical protein